MADRVLVVDDEEDTVNLVKKILVIEGYRVITASHGDQALNRARTEMPDLILLDVVMPGASGFEVCKVLKGQGGTRHIPVIMFSALGRDVDRGLGKESGADGYFTKPFTAKELTSVVRRHLEATRSSKFSRCLGVSHEQIRGRNILLEFDHSTPFERCVRDFILEARAHGESVTVLTPTTSALHRTLQRDEEVDIVPWTRNIILSSILEAHAGKPQTFIYDNFTDLIISAGFDAAYRFTQDTIARFAETQITALFLLNPDAHLSREVAAIKGLFGNQLTYGEEGLTKLRLI